MNSQFSRSEVEKKWISLQSEVKNCFKCRLRTQGIFPIFGDGSMSSKVVFVGEAPGFKENQFRKPFVGKSGQILNEFLSQINLTRDDIFISNVIKCRPPNNRDPLPDEIAFCAPFLSLQMELLPAKIVVTLGRFATRFFHENFTNMTEIVGKVFQKENFSLLPMFHPATCLYHPQKYLSLFERCFFRLKALIMEYGIYQEGKVTSKGKRNELFGLNRFL